MYPRNSFTRDSHACDEPSKVGSLSNTSAVENEWKMGQKVKHEKFGFGTVINVEGSENNTRLQIAFQAQGIKWLIAHLAKLEKVR